MCAYKQQVATTSVLIIWATSHTITIDKTMAKWPFPKMQLKKKEKKKVGAWLKPLLVMCSHYLHSKLCSLPPGFTFCHNSCFHPLTSAVATLLSQSMSEEPLYRTYPNTLFQSGQTNSALIASRNNKENQSGICPVLNRTYSLLIPLFVVDHSWPVSKQGYNFPQGIALLKSHTYCFLILEYEKRKLNLMVTYC